MFDILNLHPDTFGLDISDFSLKLVSIQKQGDELKLGAVARTSLSDDIIQRGEIKDVGKLAQAIKQLVRKTSGLKSRYAVVSLPEEKSFVRLLQMPKMSRQEIKSAVRFEAENYIPFSLEKVYLDSQIIQPLNGAPDYIEILLSALPKKTVDPYVAVIYRAGLVPVAMETESQAIIRALLKKQKTKNSVLIADIGTTCTNFSVYFGNSLRFTSFIPFSSNKLTQAIAKALNTDLKQAQKLKFSYGFQQSGNTGKKVFDALSPVLTAFSQEIKKHIDYYQTHVKYEETSGEEREVKKFLLCGGGANLRGLVSFLSQTTGLFVQKGNPLINLPAEDGKANPEIREKFLPYTAAIGLALRSYQI